MTRFSSAITLMRSCTSSAFVNGVSPGAFPSCLETGAAFASGSSLDVAVNGLVMVIVNERRWKPLPHGHRLRSSCLRRLYDSALKKHVRIHRLSGLGLGAVFKHFLTKDAIWLGPLGATVLTWGNRGGIMLPDLIGMRLRVFLPVFVPLLVGALFLFERWTGG